MVKNLYRCANSSPTSGRWVVAGSTEQARAFFYMHTATRYIDRVRCQLTLDTVARRQFQGFDEMIESIEQVCFVHVVLDANPGHWEAEEPLS